MKMTWKHMTWIMGFALVALFPSMVSVAEEPVDALAKAVLAKAGIRVGVCEMPRGGDGALAAALAGQGVAQVHGLAPDAKAAAWFVSAPRETS